MAARKGRRARRRQIRSQATSATRNIGLNRKITTRECPLRLSRSGSAGSRLTPVTRSAMPARLEKDARERVVAGYAGPPPKEQPPRNLSGKRTARPRTLWKAPAFASATAGHRRGNPPSPAGDGGESSQVPATEGALEPPGRFRRSGPVLTGSRTMSEDQAPLPLDGWHRARGARMVPFAGYAMPIQYEGHHRRASVDADKRRAVRRQPYGPGDRRRRGGREGAGGAASGRPRAS